MSIRSFIQFPDMAEAQQIIKYTEGLLGIGSEDMPESKMNDDNKMVVDGNGVKSKPVHHIVSSPKNPIMLLNELHPGLVYEVLEEKGDDHQKQFTMTVEFQGEVSCFSLVSATAILNTCKRAIG